MIDNSSNFEEFLQTLTSASTEDEFKNFLDNSPQFKCIDSSTDDNESLKISLNSALNSWTELFSKILLTNNKYAIQLIANNLCYEDLKRQALEAVKLVFNSESFNKNEAMIETLYKFIVKLPPPEPIEKNRKTFYSTEQQNGLKTLIKFKKLQRLYSLVWQNFIKLNMPENVYCDCLLFIPDNVMPHLLDPILFTDFFFKSYHLGDPYNILALNGLFVLIVKHNLDYPEFYKQVYQLLQPSIFYLRNREQFFNLLDLFLSSLHLPSYLVAAFIKRLSRLALIAPPNCVLIILSLIKNWLTRHANLECLINRTSSDSVADDPYLVNEKNPLDSNAIDSSLWEIKSLQSHYLPDVARWALFIERKIEPVEGPFVQKPANKIFIKNFNRPAKDVPLTFVPPINLFHSKVFDFDSCFAN